MERKLRLHLCANYNEENLRSAITNAILCEFVIDQLRESIKRLNKDGVDLFQVFEDFKALIDKSKEVTFASISAWEKNKVDCYQAMLGLVTVLDAIGTNSKVIKSGELLSSVADQVQSYVILLSTANITLHEIDFGSLKVKQEYIDNLLKELSLVDEGQFLSDLGTMQLSMTPLDINVYRNKFIEKKLKRANTIYNQVSATLNKEFDDLHNQIMDAYDKFYKIAYAILSDGEKADAARKVYKVIAPHRLVLDKLENRMTEANELKRQLTLHEKSLKKEKNEKQADISTLEADKENAESKKMQIDALTFVTEEYLSMIKSCVQNINALEEDIAERYKIIDKVEIALQSAIPSENEMKRYSQISFKFENLFVRLDLAKSQIKDKDPKFIKALDTAVIGLGVLMNLGIEGKDVFMRNSLLSAVFNSVNGIYDLVDNKNKSVELSQIKFVTSRLVQYSTISANLTKDLQTFRRVCNNAIRDVAILMGKPFSLKTMLEINNIIDLAIKQVQELLDTLNKNHEAQTKLLGDILNV